MNLMKLFLLVTLVFGVFGVGVVAAQEAEIPTCEVEIIVGAGNNLNVRATTSTDAEIVGTLRRGDVVTVEAWDLSRFIWLYVPDEGGWIAAGYTTYTQQFSECSVVLNYDAYIAFNQSQDNPLPEMCPLSEWSLFAHPVYSYGFVMFFDGLERGRINSFGDYTESDRHSEEPSELTLSMEVPSFFIIEDENGTPYVADGNRNAFVLWANDEGLFSTVLDSSSLASFSNDPGMVPLKDGLIRVGDTRSSWGFPANWYFEPDGTVVYYINEWVVKKFRPVWVEVQLPCRVVVDVDADK